MPEIIERRKALVLAPIGRDAGVLSRILNQAGFHSEVSPNISALLSELSEACAAVIAEEAFASAGDVEAMRQWLARQPPWSDFPFVILSLPANEADERRDALRDMLGNVTLLERPLRPDTIVRAVGASTRARERQLEAARLLEERARAEVERRAGEERLRELFENAADAIFIAGADGRLSDVNPAGCMLVGCERAALTGLAFAKLLVEEDRGAFGRWLEAQADGRPAAAEWCLQRGDGSKIDVEISARILADRRWQAFARDVSARKAAETALRQLNETLERRVAERTAELMQAQAALAQAQKMEAIGQLTGGVAHDFNNLLMAISGGLDMLTRHHEPDRRKRITDGMRQAVDRGAALTRQLLAFSRRQALEPELLALDRRIEGMGELLTRSLRGDIRVETQFAPGLWPVNVDPTQLEVAVLNLAVNARDAMPDGGTLLIRADNLPTLDDGELKGDFVSLSVSDTGAGMEPEILARVFEPFFTTKDIGKGSGLGLAQVYGFAKQSGGVVRIASARGTGTTVTLILPRSDRTAGTAEAVTEQHCESTKQGNNPVDGTVLLVEDDDEVAALVSDMIDQLGYQVIRVADGSAALKALRDGRAIDLILSDILMPGGMSGIDLAREVRRRQPDLPIVLTTGYHGQALPTVDESGIPLLRKPYRMDALAATLAAALDGGRSVNGHSAPAQQP